MALLRTEIKEKDTIIATQQKQLETLQLQVAELRGVVFGKQRKERHDPPKKKKRVTVTRSPSSYRRDTPAPSDITKEQSYPLECCQDCGGTLENTKVAIRYCEDIILPAITGEQTKTVEKQHITVGHCPQCKKQCHALPLSSQKTYLGTQVKTYVHYATYLLRLSYTQIQDYLIAMHNLAISEGEIARILEEEATTLQPHYEALKEKIRALLVST